MRKLPQRDGGWRAWACKRRTKFQLSTARLKPPSNEPEPISSNRQTAESIASAFKLCKLPRIGRRSGYDRREQYSTGGRAVSGMEKAS